jgi:tRNA A-37 threonylcarbamoyl transferase component Bud32
MFNPGHEFGDYTIIELIGEGGMGAVFRARQGKLQRDVALKVLRTEITQADLEKRFEREALTHSPLSHPNLVRVYDVGRIGTVAFIAMELVEGTNLRTRIEAEAPFLPIAALTLGRSILAGLDYLHHRRILHRDIKPGNVLIASDGQVKVADLGLAWQDHQTRLTGTGEVVGTLVYLAPELFAGGRPTAAGDIYAAGVILYQCLSGQFPYMSTRQGEMLRCVMDGEVLPLSRRMPALPAPLDIFVMRLLEQLPESRPSAKDALAEIDRLLELLEADTENELTAKKAAQPGERTQVLRRVGQEAPLGPPRFRWSYPFVIAACLLAIVVTGLLYHTRPRERPPVELKMEGFHPIRKQVEVFRLVRDRVRYLWSLTTEKAASPDQLAELDARVEQVMSRFEQLDKNAGLLEGPVAGRSGVIVVSAARARLNLAMCWLLRECIRTMMMQAPGKPVAGRLLAYSSSSESYVRRAIAGELYAARLLDALGAAAPEEIRQELLDDGLFLSYGLVDMVRRFDGKQIKCPLDRSAVSPQALALERAVADAWELDWFAFADRPRSLKEYRPVVDEACRRWERNISISPACIKPYARYAFQCSTRAMSLLQDMDARTLPLHLANLPNPKAVALSIQCFQNEQHVEAIYQQTVRLYRGESTSYFTTVRSRLMIAALGFWVLGQGCRALAPPGSSLPPEDLPVKGPQSAPLEFQRVLEDAGKAHLDAQSYTYLLSDTEDLMKLAARRRRAWTDGVGRDAIRSIEVGLAAPGGYLRQCLSLTWDMALTPDEEFSAPATIETFRRKLIALSPGIHGAPQPFRGALQAFCKRLGLLMNRNRNAAPTAELLLGEWPTVSAALRSVLSLRRAQVGLDGYLCMQALGYAAGNLFRCPVNLMSLAHLLDRATISHVQSAAMETSRVAGAWIEIAGEWLELAPEYLLTRPESDPATAGSLLDFCGHVQEFSFRLLALRGKVIEAQVVKIDRIYAQFTNRLKELAGEPRAVSSKLALWFWIYGDRHKREPLPDVREALKELGSDPVFSPLLKAIALRTRSSAR